MNPFINKHMDSLKRNNLTCATKHDKEFHATTVVLFDEFYSVSFRVFDSATEPEVDAMFSNALLCLRK